MINRLEELEQQYQQTPSNAISKEETKMSLLEAERTSNNYRVSIKYLANEETEEIIALQERILDGFDFAISNLFNVINESNYEEISRLVRFLRNKLQINMWITETEKKNMYFKTKNNNKLPKENSLFVELFFVEKYQQLTGINLVKKNK